MKIGIFLGYGPQVKLGKEGLGRYLAGLIKGFQQTGTELTIACPKWLNASLDDVLKAFGIDEERITIRNDGPVPPLWRIYYFFTRPRIKRGLLLRIRAGLKNISNKLLKSLAETRSFGYFILFGLVALPVCAVLLLPEAIVFVIWKVAKVGNKLAAKFKPKIPNGGIVFHPPQWQQEMFQQMNDAVNRRLVEMINKDMDEDVWFVPSIFWPAVNDIKRGTVVINAPDLVSQEFPIAFGDVFNAANAIKYCRETLQEGHYFITYCDYIRRELLLNQYNKEPENVIAIPHVNNSMDSYLYIDPALARQMNTDADLSKKFAVALLGGLRAKCSAPAYDEGIDWRGMRYIFYASQVRPSKNMLNLVKAYNYLLREHFVSHKLFITGNYTRDAALNNYIKENRLENDVVCFSNVPAQALAALYACADLVVNPTLYEGGFPFTFGEGMSVGTPSLMSRIPQTEDVLLPAGLEEIMFDPYDWRAIADKIEYWLPRTEELYQKELPLYEQLAARTPDVVATEYLAAFQKFARMAQTDKKEAHVGRVERSSAV